MNLQGIDWKKVSAIHAAKNSTSGVFMLQYMSEALILKGSSDVVSQYFTTKLY
jgi:hypothetical protein